MQVTSNSSKYRTPYRRDPEWICVCACVRVCDRVNVAPEQYRSCFARLLSNTCFLSLSLCHRVKGKERMCSKKKFDIYVRHTLFGSTMNLDRLVDKVPLHRLLELWREYHLKQRPMLGAGVSLQAVAPGCSQPLAVALLPLCFTIVHTPCADWHSVTQRCGFKLAPLSVSSLQGSSRSSITSVPVKNNETQHNLCVWTTRRGSYSLLPPGPPHSRWHASKWHTKEKHLPESNSSLSATHRRRKENI